jgi:peptidyl-prolyl cis-trans isomerase D
MLSLMRKHAGSWMIKVILGAIVVVFVLWGVGSWTSERSGRVATVNGETITVEEYRVTYKRLLEQVRRSFGNNLNEELIKSLNLEKQALDQLVNKLLMRQAADELQIRISDEDLSRSIRSIDAFQTAGVFDPRRYKSVLNRNNLSPEGFEINQRDALLMAKLNDFITDSVKVSEHEAAEWYKWNNAEVDIDFILFEADRYKDISVTGEEVKEFFENNKQPYKTDPQLKVRYLKFEPQAYVSQVEIFEDEIQEYYEDHLDEFQKPKTVEARHILIKVDQEAAPEQASKAKEQIERVLQQAREGKDFAELAQQYSEGPSKDKGGYLGAFKKEDMVKPFSDKAFSMKAGEISDPVRTRFGWHIIKVEKVNEAHTTPLIDAQADIRKNFTDERSKQIAYDVAEAIYDATFEGSSLDQVAAENKLSIRITDFFTRQGPQKGIKDKAQFANAAFDLSDGEVSEIQDFGDGYYLMEVIEKRPARIPELEEVEQKVKADLIEKKKSEKAKMDAEDLLTALKDGQDMETAGKKFDLKPTNTGFFKRNDSIPNIGFEREISRVAFELSDQKRMPQEVLNGRKGYYVIKFNQRKAPAMPEFDKEKADITERLLQQKRSKALNGWLEAMKKRSEIVYMKGLLDS